MLFKVILVGLLVSHRVNSMRFEDSKRGTDNKKHCVKFERGGVSAQWSKLKRWFDWSAPLTGTSADVGSARTAMPDQLAQDSRRNRRPRLAGSSLINIEDAPWAVSFQLYWQEYCGGNIVTEEHILTDAYCLVTTYYNAYKIRTYAFFGGDRIHIRVGSTFRDSEGKIVYTKQLCVSPHFLKFGNYIDGSLGVITLTEKLKFGITIQPLPLHPATDVKEGLACQVAGYGLTMNQSIDNMSDRQLQRIDVQVNDHKKCTAMYTQKRAAYPSELLCLLSLDSATCSGDLGDGLYCNGMLLGVTYSSSTCNKEKPHGSSIFTRVDKGFTRDFIDSIIEAESNGATRNSYNGYNNIVLGLIASLKWLFCQ